MGGASHTCASPKCLEVVSARNGFADLESESDSFRSHSRAPPAVKVARPPLDAHCSRGARRRLRQALQDRDSFAAYAAVDEYLGIAAVRRAADWRGDELIQEVSSLKQALQEKEEALQNCQSQCSKFAREADGHLRLSAELRRVSDELTQAQKLTIGLRSELADSKLEESTLEMKLELR